MLGLVKKDLICIYSYGKRTYLMLILFFGAIELFSKSSGFSSFITVFLSVMPITAIALDERAKWDKYVITMPIQRKALALSKYFLGLILLCAGGLFSFVVEIIVSRNIIDALVIAVVSIAVGMLFQSLCLPLTIKFGAEKGRYVLMFVVVVPTVLVTSLSKMLPTLMNDIDPKIMTLLPILLFLVAIIVFMVSALISMAIYQKKEFN